ncbi:hypothetical protein [Oerskovia flava]|uniref:hypothetical protein n=1 Tax=Oerskovia flava TaxID=2986422 RepID=UPI00223FD708|nr:hypothetical protein [Oerskovia sp. JB1-3-2]
MESTAGLTALALFVLWLGYYVPHRVSHRQTLLESRTEDRFSGSLRVLAVASGLSVPAQQHSAVAAITDRPHVGAGPSLLLATAGSGGHVRPGPADRPQQEEGTYAMESTPRASGTRPSAVPRPQTGAHPTVPAARQGAAAARSSSAPSRIAVLERRAAAARRRLTLTVLLLLVSAGAWAAVVLTPVPWFVAAGPTALLALVLVLGRRAVLAGQRADAAWLAERRANARGAARAARAVPGSPAAPRNARPRVTGHAVHASQTSTQMIPRVTDHDLSRARSQSGGQRAGTSSTARGGETPADEPEAGDARMTVTEGFTTSPGAALATALGASADASVEPTGDPDARPAGSGDDSAAQDASPSGRAWDPVPVPRPTYTMKATAPRREPAPLPEDVASGAAPAPEGAAPAQEAAADRTGGGGGEPVVSAGDEPRPSTETLGLDLNEILARRRAAGQ